MISASDHGTDVSFGQVTVTLVGAGALPSEASRMDHSPSAGASQRCSMLPSARSSLTQRSDPAGFGRLGIALGHGPLELAVIDAGQRGVRGFPDPGVDVACTPDGQEEVAVGLHRNVHLFLVDTRTSGSMTVTGAVASAV